MIILLSSFPARKQKKQLGRRENPPEKNHQKKGKGGREPFRSKKKCPVGVGPGESPELFRQPALLPEKWAAPRPSGRKTLSSARIRDNESVFPTREHGDAQWRGQG
jgi:hypothetical protein